MTAKQPTKSMNMRQDLKRICPTHRQYYVKEQGVQPAREAQGKKHHE